MNNPSSMNNNWEDQGWKAFSRDYLAYLLGPTPRESYLDQTLWLSLHLGHQLINVLHINQMPYFSQNPLQLKGHLARTTGAQEDRLCGRKCMPLHIDA